MHQSPQAELGFLRYVVAACVLCGLLLAGMPLSVHAGEAQRPAATGDAVTVRDGTVRSGDSVSSLLGDVLTPPEIYDLSKQCRGVFPLTKLRAGQTYRVQSGPEGFHSFRYDIDEWEYLLVTREDAGFSASVQKTPIDVVEETMHGEVRQRRAFTAAMRDAGGDRGLALRLADIFAFRFNAWREVRKGDTFTLLVEKKYRRGECIGYGRILAAAFFRGDTAYEAFWFKNEPDGRASYFDAAGKNLQPYLRAPLETYELASGFASRRLHPVTKRWQPHYAIDYSAPRGTPVYATSDGRIDRMRRDRKSGRYLAIEHEDGYESLYLHLTAYAKDIAVGDRVVQGQVIGYVGSTGYATGPHLDFRLKKNGRLVNPRGNRSLASRDLTRREMRYLRRRVIASRVRMGTTRLAHNDSRFSAHM
ncbi:M23 family metallopeptidase [Desulfobaculum senezii]